MSVCNGIGSGQFLTMLSQAVHSGTSGDLWGRMSLGTKRNKWITVRRFIEELLIWSFLVCCC